MGRDACARGVYKGGLYRGRGEVGWRFACGKRWWLGWACGRKSVWERVRIAVIFSEKRAGVSLFRCGYGVRGWWLR